MVVIVAPGHELASFKAIAPQQLGQLPYVSREVGSGTREFADDYLRQAGINSEDLNIVMELGSPEAVKGIVETGLGFGIVSRATVTKEVRLGTLLAIPLEPRLVRVLSVVYPKEKFRSRLLTTFLEFASVRMKSAGKQ